MAGNSFGSAFRITTFGESHGPGVGVIIDGCPPRIDISEGDIQKEVDRRAPGSTPWATQRKERDRVKVLSGIFDGRTLGTPICLAVYNEDVDSKAYEPLMSIFRPGHGDFTYYKKYGIRDPRGGGRSSARENVARLAAGAIAKKVLFMENISILSFTRELGGIEIESFDPEEIQRNPLLCPDRVAAQRMMDLLKEAKDSGDSVGGVVEIRVEGCPAGLGEPVFDKLDADLAKALMSIGAVKGVEVGDGFRATRLFGSQCNDQITSSGFQSNHSGGILGGISNGEEIVVRVAVKPVPSIRKPQKTIDEMGEERTVKIEGRHDVSAIPRINPVCEAMVAIVLADHLLRWKAIK
ncbi:MAG: chorismate synthase [Candidatus Bathyarchaeia archaeon]